MSTFLQPGMLRSRPIKWILFAILSLFVILLSGLKATIVPAIQVWGFNCVDCGGVESDDEDSSYKDEVLLFQERAADVDIISLDFPDGIEAENTGKPCSTNADNLDDPNYRACKISTEYNSGKVIMVIAILGVAVILVLAFFIWTHVRKTRARRRTIVHSISSKSALKPSQPENTIGAASLNADGVHDVENGKHQSVIEGGEMGTIERHIRPVNTTLDGANDGWSQWMRNNGVKLKPVHRLISPVPRTSVPQLPPLTLPKPILNTVRLANGIVSVKNNGLEGEPELRRPSVHWAPTV